MTTHIDTSHVKEHILRGNYLVDQGLLGRCTNLRALCRDDRWYVLQPITGLEEIPDDAIVTLRPAPFVGDCEVLMIPLDAERWSGIDYILDGKFVVDAGEFGRLGIAPKLCGARA